MTPPPFLKSIWLRRAAWTLGSLALFWLLAWLGVPPLLKHQLQSRAGEQLGRKVSVGAVDFKPWSLELTVSDLAVATADGQRDQLRIGRLYMDASAQSLLKLAPVIDTLSVDTPTVHLTHLGGGHYDVDDILARLTADTGAPSSEPAKFALYNVTLNGGAADFTDQTVGRTHTLRDLRLALPFLSNLDALRAVRTEPLLAFRLNGSQFDSGARTLPFAETRQTDATLKISGLDLTPYAGYLPASVPVRLVSAVLDADLKVAFEQQPKPYTHVSGVVTASGVKLLDGRQQDLLAFDRLQVQVTQLRLLERKVDLASLELDRPTLALHRAADGTLNLAGLASGGSGPAGAAASPAASAAGKLPAAATVSAPASAAVTASVPGKTSKTIAKKDHSTLGEGQKSVKKPAADAWGVTLARLAVRDARVNWLDEATGNPAPARLALKGVTLDATGIATPVGDADITPIAFSGSAALVSSGAPVKTAGASGASGAAPGGTAKPSLKTGKSTAAARKAAGSRKPAKTRKAGTTGKSEKPGKTAKAGKSGRSGQAGKSAKSGKSAALQVADGFITVSTATPATASNKTGAAVGKAASVEATPPDDAAGRLQFSGLASTRSVSVTATIGALPLSLGAPYLATYLEPALSGALDAVMGLHWQAADKAGADDAITLAIDRLALSRLALQQGRDTLASVQLIELSGAQINALARSARLGKLLVKTPKLEVARAPDGRWRAQEWLKEAKQVRADKAANVAAGKAGAEVPWKLALDELVINGGALDWRDETTARPVAASLSDLQLQLRQFALGAKQPATLQLAAKLGAGSGTPGRLSYKGTLGTEPARAKGALELVRLPAHAFEPYFGGALNIDLLRALASFKGTVDFTDTLAGPRLRVMGDTRIDDLLANSLQGTAVAGAASPAPAGSATAKAAPARPAAPATTGPAEEALSWQALELRGVDVALTPGVTTTVVVKETAISDFYARVILFESGRLNLQDVVKTAPPAEKPAAAATAGASIPVRSDSKTIAKKDQATLAIAKKDSKNDGQAAAGGTAPGVRIDIGPISLTGGKVYFSDRFIKPNYSADLTELTGRLSGFSSVPATGSPQLADLELRGRAAGTGSLEILGKVNPLAQPLVLDIKGKVRDLELPPLTPYSVKYAGHGIERGKLSVDVGYKVLPDGQLTANHKIVLNQLRFGDPVEGAPASLPVRLAVALLADRNGVIDIDLPVSGSLNDPQFSLGGVIWKIIGNLIVKAITAPFSLLASALGGGDELSTVAFAPGSAVLTPQAAQGLDKVAKALTERPALKMTVVGTASLEVERDAWKRQRLQALLLAEKRRALGDAAKGSATVVVSAAETPELLKAVYKRADFPKPRNLVGLAKDIPQPEMEALLLANISATEETMQALATQRGTVVRDYLAAQKLPLDRLFLGAPRTGAQKPGAAAPLPAGAASAPAGGGAGAESRAPWRPRAELVLATS